MTTVGGRSSPSKNAYTRSKDKREAQGRLSFMFTHNHLSTGGKLGGCVDKCG